ncbi:hypothetical protein [Mesoaciditoga sp.]
MGIFFGDYYVGLDVGRYKAEGVKLKKSGKKIETVGSITVPYANKAFDGEIIADESEIAVALGKIKMALNINIEDHITTALFPDRILFRKLELPIMPRDQAANAAKFQIVKELSISPDEINVEVEVRQKSMAALDVSSFVVKVEDISTFNGLLFKAGLPFPDILDAGYFKYNYLVRDKFFKGVSFVVVEDISSTYVELFKDDWLIGIDSIPSGSEGLEELDEDMILSHYMDLNDKIQNLARMMLSRYSMAEVVVENLIYVSEFMENVHIWEKSSNNLNLAKNVLPYDKVIVENSNLPLAAYSLAMRGVKENTKNKFLQKKGSKSKAS